MLEQRAFQCLTIPPSSNRIPDLKPAILVSASMDRSSFATFKPHLGMQPPKTLIFNICRTNSNGQHYQQYRFNGRSSSLLFNASTNPNAKPLQNLFTNGSCCKTNIKSTVHLPITHAPPVTAPLKQQHTSSHVRTLTVKPSGQNSMTKY